jgi:hypothetical protein
VAEERRIRLYGTADGLKRELVEKIRKTLKDEEMVTINRADITIPPVVIDDDPRDDIEITIPEVVIDNNPTD